MEKWCDHFIPSQFTSSSGQQDNQREHTGCEIVSQIGFFQIGFSCIQSCSAVIQSLLFQLALISINLVTVNVVIPLIIFVWMIWFTTVMCCVDMSWITGRILAAVKSQVSTSGVFKISRSWFNLNQVVVLFPLIILVPDSGAREWWSQYRCIKVSNPPQFVTFG